MKNKKTLNEIKKHRVDGSSVFFSTVSSWLYYIVSSLVLAIIIEVITSVSYGSHILLLYWISIIIYALAMIMLYVFSKKYKKKHDKLEIKQLSFKSKAIRVVIMLGLTVVISTIISIIHIAVVFRL